MHSQLFTKDVKISFEYKKRTVTVDVKPYQKISELKEIANKVFFPIKNEISITYQNQDLDEFGQILIGDHFNQKTSIKLKVVPKIIKKEYRISDKSIEQNDPKKKLLSCLCGKYYISNYCRTCKKFICNHCKIKKEHKLHKNISVNTNKLLESTKNYAMTLKNDIYSNIETSKKYFNKFQSSKFIEGESWKEIIIRKYQDFYDKYEEYLNKYKIHDDSGNKINEFINESKKDDNEINNIINNLNQNSKKLGYKMTLDEFKEFFDNLTYIEDKIHNISKNNKLFIKNYKLNEGFNQINSQIDKILDFALQKKKFLGVSDSEDEKSNINTTEDYNNDENNYDDDNNSNIKHSQTGSKYEEKEEDDENNNYEEDD